MKRVPASLVTFAVVAAFAALFQTGCVSQGEYDKLLASERACNSDRDALKTQLATLQARLDSQGSTSAQYNALLAEKDGRIAALMTQVDRMATEYDAMRADRDKYLQLASQRKPGDIIINEGGSTEVKLAAPVHEALKRFAETHPGVIEYDAKLGLVRFSTDLLFALGSYEVAAEQIKLLGDFAEVINIPEAQQYDVLVVGHTDNVPIKKASTKEKTPTNWHLSVYRAVAVLLALKDKGVNPDRMGATGFGEQRPRVPNTARGGTKENRRVEIFLVPKGSIATAG